MISTPYKHLAQALGRPDGWHPSWAQKLERRRIDGRSVFIAQPHRLEAGALAELATLSDLGWNVTIDAPTLSRLRVTLTPSK